MPDDIMIGTHNMKEHNKTLDMLFQRAENSDITSNKDKCRSGVQDLEFYRTDLQKMA